MASITIHAQALDRDDDGDEEFDAPLRRRRILTTPWIGAAITAAIVLCAGIVLLHDEPGGAQAKPVVQAAARVDWVDIPQPSRLLRSSLPGEALVYRAQRQIQGAWRRDQLASGPMDGRSESIEVVLEHGPAMPAPPRTLFIEMVRRAAEHGFAITRFDQPFLVPTRLGLVEMAHLALSGATAEQACLGFRLGAAASPARLDGIACGATKDHADPATLACTIDSLHWTLDESGNPAAPFLAEGGGIAGSACKPVILPVTAANAEPTEADPPPAERTVKHRRRHVARRAVS